MRGRPRTGVTPRASYRLPAATLEQIQQLREGWGVTATAVIVRVVEAMTKAQK